MYDTSLLEDLHSDAQSTTEEAISLAEKAVDSVELDTDDVDVEDLKSVEDELGKGHGGFRQVDWRRGIGVVVR